MLLRNSLGDILAGQLGDLVLAILATVPPDPYGGQPFRYDAGKGVVYSAGPDFEGDGGSGVRLYGRGETVSLAQTSLRDFFKRQDVVFDLE